jgi:hypothetical protein
MNLFQLIGVLTKWGPLIINAVYFVEQLFGPGLTGPQKKAAALAWLSDRHKDLEAKGISMPWGPSAIEAIGTIIDAIVSILNFFRQFRHRSLATEAEVTAASALAEELNVLGRVEEVKQDDPELAAFLLKMGV